jgi:hypothetical protein
LGNFSRQTLRAERRITGAELFLNSIRARKKMRKLLSVWCLCLLAASAFAQTPNQLTFKVYDGQEYMPRLFEPYRATYIFKAGGLGLSLPLFELSTHVVELQDHWEEEVTFRLNETLREKLNSKMSQEDKFPEAIFITNKIDLKTGLLQEMRGETKMGTGENVRFLLALDGAALTASGWVNNKLAENKVQPFSEKVYPCYSFTFINYLPLKEGFAGEFQCLVADEKDNLVTGKRFIKVVGSETLTTDAGTFDCFKLLDEGEQTATRDGKKAAPDYRDQYGIMQYFSGLHSYSWVDKKTRKLVKAELGFKKFGAKVTLELKPQSVRVL